MAFIALRTFLVAAQLWQVSAGTCAADVCDADVWEALEASEESCESLPDVQLLQQNVQVKAIKDLSDATFEAYIQQQKRVMVYFVKDVKEQEAEELLKAKALLGKMGSKASIARVDAAMYPSLTKRFVPTLCDEERKECRARFPQLLWFVNGKPTRYHRSFWESNAIASYVMALDRDYVTSVRSEEKVVRAWGRLLLFRGEKNSKMYKAVEHIAARHMDTTGAAHIEEKGSSNLSWIVNKSVVDSYEGGAEEEHLEAWVRRHLVWSEDAPDESTNLDEHAGVGSLVVVGQTFEQLVLRPDSDVFLMVYAPWCGFSRQVLPVWDRFARAAAGTAGLVVAKMDGDRNIVSTQDFYFSTYPTIVYVKAGQKKPILYEGERSIDEFKAFALRHSALSLSFNATTGRPADMDAAAIADLDIADL